MRNRVLGWVIVGAILESISWANATVPNSCSTFRLDQVPGNAFNPEGSGSADRHPYVVPVYQNFQNEERGSGDTKNCVFSSLAGLLNYRLNQSVGGTAVPSRGFSSAYFSARNCRSMIQVGDPALYMAEAVRAYNEHGSCDVPGLDEIVESAAFQDDLLVLLDASIRAAPGPDLVRAQGAICRHTLGGVPSSPVLRSLIESIVQVSSQIASSTLEQQRVAEERWRLNLHSLSSVRDRTNFDRCTATLVMLARVCTAEHIVRTNPPLALDTHYFAETRDFTPEDRATRQVSILTCERENRSNSAAVLECLRREERRTFLQREFRFVSASNPEPVPVNIPGHMMLLMGREMREGQCGYWFRNSYRCGGGTPAVPLEHQCDPSRPEMVWISESALLESNGIQRAYHVAGAAQ